MSSSPHICSPVSQTTSNDYFTLKGFSTTSSHPESHPHRGQSYTPNDRHTYGSGHIQPSESGSGSKQRSDEITYDRFFEQPSNIAFSNNQFTFHQNNQRPGKAPNAESSPSPLMNRPYNSDSTSFSSDSTTSDSFFLRHKGRNDSANSTNTLIDDASPVKLQLDLPKLSINENMALDFQSAANTPVNHSTSSHASKVPLTNSPAVSVSSDTATTPITPLPRTYIGSDSPVSSPKFRSHSLGFGQISHPSLTKFMTSPNLKTFNDPRRQTQDYISQIKGLPANIDLINKAELTDLFSRYEVVPEIGLPNLLIIDIRSFTEYVNNHFTNAINLSLPSTLLRRSNFSFMRVINSLPTYEKMVLKTYFNFEHKNKQDNKTLEYLSGIECGLNGYPSILVYDNQPNSMNMYNILKKIVEQFKPRSQRIFVVNENFSDISETFVELGHLESGNKQHFDINELVAKDTDVYKDIAVGISEGGKLPRASESLRPANINTSLSHLGADRMRSRSLNEIPQINQVASPVESSTPILSNFKLPSMNDVTTKFKIRHNEEVLNDTKCLGISLANKYQSDLHRLPSWLSETKIDEQTMVYQFNKLESNEKDRLNNAFSNSSNCSLLGAGIEKGYKNRYKDILLFEHSRVKLNDFGEVVPSKICDYINASYINSIDGIVSSPQSELSGQEKYFTYLASQGPLQHTVGDFYKMLINNNTRIIVSLTDEWENGLMKCEPYWLPGTYKSNENNIEVVVQHNVKVNDGLVMRVLDVSTVDENTGTTLKRSIIQLQLLDWLDNDICANMKNLLFILKLKDELTSSLNLGKYATLVHCSAGCGRTGTFIAVDTLIKLMQVNYPITDDLPFRIVDSLRCQRISMVQNLRQYISVFEILINVFLQREGTEINCDIIEQFKNTVSNEV